MLRACRMPVVIRMAVVSLSVVAGQSVGVHSQSASFHSRVDTVALNITVTDPSGRYIADLGRGDFQIVEDGRRQDVTFFQASRLRLALALLIDTSASMASQLGVAQEARCFECLGAQDVASVVDFDTSVRVAQEFTGDRPALERAIRTKADGSTALYNAVYIALKELNKSLQDEPGVEKRRRAIVMLSDGEDTSSMMTFDDILDAAARADTTIYTIGLVNRDPAAIVRNAVEPQYVLRRLAQQTGGRAFFIADARELSAVYAEIRAELANQYLLAYEPTNLRRDGQFRRVAVRVERSDAVARARPGYYAPTR